MNDFLCASYLQVVETTGPALVLSGTKSGDKIHLFAVPPSDTWGKEYIIDEPGKYKLISEKWNIIATSIYNTRTLGCR